MNIEIKNDCRGMDNDSIISALMKNRGVDYNSKFFNPDETDLLPLTDLKNIENASEIVIDAINNNLNIGVWFDVDTDGICSGTIISRYLKDQGVEVKTNINNGKAHGLYDQDLSFCDGLDVLIIVDSLDEDINQYKTIKELYGTKIIILDHHLINSKIDYNSYVILVSSQNDYCNKELCGSGVVLKFCLYLDSVLGTDYAQNYFDLSAVGLIADMMDVAVIENRYIISKGFSNVVNPAIKKIIGSYEFNANSVGYSIAPLINATMRVNKNDLAKKAFMYDGTNKKELSTIINGLKNCKLEQETIITDMMPDIEKQIDEQKDSKYYFIVIDSEYGVSGLLANKIMFKYHRPVFIVTEGDTGYNGSMRTPKIDGCDNFAFIINSSGLASAIGHESASGFSVSYDDEIAFKEWLDDYLTNHDVVDNSFIVDIQLNLEDIDNDLIKRIKEIDKISGMGFPPILVYVDDIRDYQVSTMSDGKHLRIKPSEKYDIIWWNHGRKSGEFETAEMFNEPISCICTLDSGFFGRKYSLKLICQNIECSL